MKSYEEKKKWLERYQSAERTLKDITRRSRPELAHLHSAERDCERVAAEIVDAIQRLDDVLGKEILYRRYILGTPLNEMRDIPYEYRSIKRHCREAIEQLDI